MATNPEWAEVKVKIIANGLLVKTQDGWFSFRTWDDASKHIESALVIIRKRLFGKR